MENKKTSIKLALLKLFNEGKSETEALGELSKTHSSRSISEKVVNNWYEKFRSENQDLEDTKVTDSENKLSDEFLVDLVNSNSDLSMEKLAKLTGISKNIITNRVKKLRNGKEEINYCDKTKNKTKTKFTDEFLIDLINKNPDLNMGELAKLAGTSTSTISVRIRKINSNGIRVNYVKKQYIPDGYNTPITKITYEYLADLINNNPDLTMHELSELAGVSAATINRRVKKFNKASKTLSYCMKDTKKYTDEFLVNFINKNSEANMVKLANLIGASSSTISARIKDFDADGRINYSGKYKKKFTDEFLINLDNNNPDLNINQLSKIAGGMEHTTIDRIKKVNSKEERIKYFKKSLKFTDQYLIDLVDKNPELNLKELAEIAGVVPETIARRIKKINSNGVAIRYTNKSTRNKSLSKEKQEKVEV